MMRNHEWTNARKAKAVAALLALFSGSLIADSAMAQRQPRQAPPSGAEAPAGAGGAGRYAVLREENKDTGCLVNLLASGRAQLGPGCKDQGVVVFDPIGWSGARNSIVLRARKGHRINFVYKPDGVWLREPADKRPLALRKY